jgi:hypothetical protein
LSETDFLLKGSYRLSFLAENHLPVLDINSLIAITSSIKSIYRYNYGQSPIKARKNRKIKVN